MTFKNTAYNLFFLLLIVASEASAQTEIKTEPLSLAFTNLKLGVEQPITETTSLELIARYDLNLLSLNLLNPENNFSVFASTLRSKFYFSPEILHDGLFMGPYGKYQFISYELGTKHQRFFLGYTGGYKWILKSNFYFEFSYGLGVRIFQRYVDENDIRVDKELIPTRRNFPLDFFSQHAVGYRF